MRLMKYGKFLQSKLVKDTETFIPQIKQFNAAKWNKPLNEELRAEIKLKKIKWKNYMQNRDVSSLKTYRKQSNKIIKLNR